MSAATFRYAVLAPAPSPDGGWSVIHANGDLAAARAAAEAWALANPGRMPMVVQALPEQPVAAVCVQWQALPTLVAHG